MEEQGRYSCCCSGAETGLHRQDPLIRLLLRRESHQQRLARGCAAALLLLVSGAVVLLVTLVLRGGPAKESQPVARPHRHSSGVSGQQQDHHPHHHPHHHHHHHHQRQQQGYKNPNAMLTAPQGKNGDVKYLQWERIIGHAFCHGGFYYSDGNLTVPRKGLYRVFLQITYESQKDFPCKNWLTLSTSVLYTTGDSYKNKTLLLSSHDTVSCDLTKWKKSLYTAGLFTLEAGSRLHVTSSYTMLIMESESSVFFGAELIELHESEPEVFCLG